MNYLNIQFADLAIFYELCLISKNFYQIPYKYNAFRTIEGKPAVQCRF